ncbi:PilN domain-containing protein [Pallidibacillus pasinlerensis]|uniref:Fimbrial assembly protein n=1 Tax=Pallidibacillus pasinlerensis TaxID=2703818 RepID=A0ABX0A296_9BACI|nr:PilN domain-containing protein [Pallidibacillus pasinlerensis]NCU16937.1 hypothetical protein [Pallidibacillus pasinlerensis]
MIPDINLLPSKERDSDKTSFILLIVLIIWAILLGVIILQYFLAKNANDTIQSRVESLQMQKGALEAQLQNQQSQRVVVSLAESVEFAEKLTAPTSKIIKELNELLPDYSFLTDYNFNAGQVSIQTEFDSLNQVAEYVTSLNQSEIFSDVKVDNISTFRIEEGTEEEVTDAVFEEMPRYDVSFSLEINMTALLPDTGGEDDNE